MLSTWARLPVTRCGTGFNTPSGTAFPSVGGDGRLSLLESSTSLSETGPKTVKKNYFECTFN